MAAWALMSLLNAADRLLVQWLSHRKLKFQVKECTYEAFSNDDADAHSRCGRRLRTTDTRTLDGFGYKCSQYGQSTGRLRYQRIQSRRERYAGPVLLSSCK